MQQRKAVAGRPSGTDGSDFSYRMVVDSRYTKVAQGKSRLRLLISAQAISQVIGLVWVIFLASQENALDMLNFWSIGVGFISLITGELGRRRSYVNLLKLYIAASSIATLLSVACIVRSDLLVEVLQDQNISMFKKFEVVEAGHVLLSVLLQIFVIITTASLIQNMSPKRAS